MEIDWHELVSQPQYQMRIEEDIFVPMRDGECLCCDIYRPDAEGKFPALLSYTSYGKDLQKLPCPPHPSDYVRGTGGHEAGMSEYFVPRGYVHIIVEARGIGKSGGQDVDAEQKGNADGYDIVEWIAKQPWCNGNVGMLGMSGFALIQYNVAFLNPPHLKAIFLFEAFTDVYRHSYYHGGILSYYFLLHLQNLFPSRLAESESSREFSKEQLESIIQDLRNNEDIRGVPYLYILTMAPHKNPRLFDALTHPYDGPFYQVRSAYTKFDRIKVPCYFLSRWNGWAVHLPGAFDGYMNVNTPKKLMITTTDNIGGFDRPWHEHHDVVLRWYDHWLKGVDTGVMNEPPIRILVQGINEWRYEGEWPLARTKWTKFYLRGGGVLSQVPPSNNESPTSFTNTPWAQQSDPIPSVKYMTKPLSEDVEVTGPSALYFYASLSSQDANWFITIKDIDIDGLEKVVSKGWLRASHRELDESKSKPYKPFHPHTRSLPIEPGKVYDYLIDIRETSNVFKTGHRIQLEIAGEDRLEGIWYHLPNMRETQHIIYNSHEYLSYLLLPIVPR